jgi:hypothetical protein
MSRVIGSLASIALVCLAAVAGAQNQPAPPVRAAASSFGSVEVHVNSRSIGRGWYEEDAALTGPSRIAITYGQPHARGRQIVGGLIPNDTVWRLGANAATTLHSDLDLTIGPLAVPRGDYSLFLLHRGDAWQLIVNSRTGEWGTDHDAAKDVGRVPLKPRTMTDNEETLTIYLVPDSPNPRSGYGELAGVLRIRWGTLDLSTPWTVKR